jgi:PAS domain S-box-containing protein
MHPSDEVNRILALSEGERFFELSLDMLAIAGYDGYFKRVNPAWEASLGWTPAELMAVPYLDFVHPADRSNTILEARRISEDEQQCLRFENRYRCKDGSYRWLYWSSSPFPSERLMYAVAKDITARKEAEIALVEALAEVRELSGLLPICAWCKKVRDDQGYWGKIEDYVEGRTKAQFTHSICPDCRAGVLGEELP